ncbi:cytochrome b/b6 domain-containing protein [Halodesulfovibrio aestuarii]|uniref:cytochrome b/b6 domain-containing protein n=1 Tax=Halodesulfovibrio aestuarii TaxID=126333 RepID=UPI003D33A4B3
MFIKQASVCLVLTLALFMAGVVHAAGGTAAHSEQLYSKAAQLRQGALKQNQKCFSCHGDAEITAKWVTDRGRTLQLHVDEVDYRNSVHSGQSCQSCHEGATEDAFASAPHKFKNKKPMDCQSCHGNYFKDIYEQVDHSYHTKAIVKKGKEFSCASCHDAHTFHLPERTEEIASSVAETNKRCFRCHSDLRGYQKLTDKKLLDQKMGHWFLPNKEKHFESVSCVSCHGGKDGTEVHVIMEVKDIKVNCESCHSKSSAMTDKLNKYRSEQRAFSMVNKGLFDDAELQKKNGEAIKASMGEADSILGFMNARLLDGKYVIGVTQTPWLNSKFVQVLAAMLLLIAVHAALRMAGTKAVHADGETVTMFPLAVRIWHWSNAVLFAILIVSGFAMHFGVGMHFESAQSTHAYLALGLVALWILYLLYLILSGQLKQYLPRADVISASIAQAKYYMLGIYKGQENPAGHNPEKRLNPLQQGAYLSVLFVLFPVLIASGLALFIPEVIPHELMGIDGKWCVSLVHIGSAFLMVLFIVIHLYLCTTGESIFALIRSMVTGKMKK